MIVTLLFLAELATRAVVENVQESVRASVDRTETECEYVETTRLASGASIQRWRIRNPPDSNRDLSEGARSSREMVRVHLIDCIDVEGARKHLANRLAEVGKDGIIEGLGDEAVFRRRAGDDSRTVIDFRAGHYAISVSAPTGPIARRFAQATAAALIKSGGEQPR